MQCKIEQICTKHQKYHDKSPKTRSPFYSKIFGDVEHFVKIPNETEKKNNAPKLWLSENDKIDVPFLSEILLVSPKPSSHPGICYKIPFFLLLG